MPRCRHCDDELPDDCPADLTNCRSYCNWRTQERGNMLTEDEARDFELFTGLCDLDVACRNGLKLPELN